MVPPSATASAEEPAAPGEAPSTAGVPPRMVPIPGAEKLAVRIVGPDDGDPDRPRIMLQMPVNVRSISLVVLALLACFFALHWAAAVLIPLLLALLITYALSPVVTFMERLHVPRFASAALLLLAIVGGLGTTAYRLSDDAADLINSLPVAAGKLRATLRDGHSTRPSPIDNVQQAASQLEQATQPGTPQLPPRGVTRVIVERAPFNVRDYLWSGTVGLMGFAGQMTVVLFLSFFALCAGDTFRRKLVKITGPSLTRKKITVQVLDEITAQIQRYLIVQALMSMLVGAATWLAFWALGVEYAPVWGVAAAVTNLIPYIGAVAVAGGSALVAFMQFGSLHMALAAGGSALVIHAIVGALLTPWLTSRASSMNAVVVFASVLVWGWVWGIWGLLLGIPVMMVIKAICDRVEDLQPIGELMSA